MAKTELFLYAGEHPELNYGIDIYGQPAIGDFAVTDDGRVLLADTSDGIVYNYSPSGKLLWSYSPASDGLFPSQIASGDNGICYFLDSSLGIIASVKDGELVNSCALGDNTAISNKTLIDRMRVLGDGLVSLSFFDGENKRVSQTFDVSEKLAKPVSGLAGGDDIGGMYCTVTKIAEKGRQNSARVTITDGDMSTGFCVSNSEEDAELIGLAVLGLSTDGKYYCRAFTLEGNSILDSFLLIDKNKEAVSEFETVLAGHDIVRQCGNELFALHNTGDEISVKPLADFLKNPEPSANFHVSSY